ncbi:MAG: PTS cellobiose transporter subunit IIC [Tissierellia bacterium]|nr:PTS cellobiose transporter subunit IIC [Tissierellia bacterium]
MEKIENIAVKLGSNRYLKSLRDGIVLSMPLVIIGSLFLIIASFPIQSWLDFLEKTDAAKWFTKITNGSFGIIGLVSSFGIARSLTNSYDEDGVASGILSLSAYLIMTPLFADETTGYSLDYLGSRGLFAAIVISMISAKIYHFFVSRNIVIKMPDGVPPAVSESFSSLIPGAVILSLAGLSYFLFDLFGLENIHDFLSIVLGKPLGILGGSIFGTVIATLLNSLFWIIGIHPGATVNAVMNPIWLVASDANRLAYEAGKELPNIVTQSFMDNFVWMGGGGSTIGLVICMLLFSKSKQSKTLTPLAGTPGIFNINEPLTFGFPIVFNFKMAIPFILSPAVIAIISYLAMDLGFVHKTVGAIIPWTMPPIISGYLATGGRISGAILQIICIIVSVFIYYPFFKMADNESIKQEKELENGKEIN